MPAECNYLLLGALGSFSDKLSERKGGKGCEDETSQGSKDTSSTRQCCGGHKSEMLRRPNNMDSHCVFVLLLPGHLLVLYCPHYVLNSMWNVALPALLTSLNSSGDRGQGHSLGLVFMVRWNVNSGWEKRGEVIMRDPPSAGCLFGQTGCLTALAVDGILMDMTNDSLSPFLRIPSHSTLFSHFSFSSFCCMWTKLKMLNSQEF